MSLLRLASNLGKACAVVAAVFAVCPTVFAEGWLTCWHHCPPSYVYRTEGPPRIKFTCGCPKAVCDLSTLEHYGYSQTCWRPWSFPPDWSHCPVPPPAALKEGAPIGLVMPPVDSHPMPTVNGKR
jgi:hypothetical protein